MRLNEQPRNKRRYEKFILTKINLCIVANIQATADASDRRSLFYFLLFRFYFPRAPVS